MSDHRLADRAARVLRAARANVGPRTTAEPARAVPAIAEAIRGSARRRRARMVGMTAGAIALASAALVVLLVRAGGPVDTGIARRRAIAARAQAPGPRPTDPGAAGGSTSFRMIGSTAGRRDSTGAGSGRAPAVFVSGGGTRIATAGASFAPGDTLAAGGVSLALAAGDGTEIRLAPKSEVTLVRSDVIRWFQLQTGSLEAHVAKLVAGERFVIATPDRQVEVRGTRFRVSLVRADAACGEGTITRVTVDEGVVTVRAARGVEARVAAGERWPAACPEPPPATQVASQERAADRSAKPQGRPEPRPSDERLPPSTLSAENDLFGQAARAERSGDSSTALRLLDRLIARYPASPLRETAEGERDRIRKGLRR